MAAIENVALWHERDISHSSVERVIVPDSCILLNYMLDLAIKLLDNLIIYPENMRKNLNLTRGLVFSQSILLRLTEKGITREKAYAIVQSAAMEVWANENKNLKTEIMNSSEALEYISREEIEEIFDESKMLKNIDYIFARSIGE